MRIHHRILSRFAVLLLAAATVLFAQEFRGTLTGTVIDPSGASVPKAHVRAVNDATQQTYNSITNSRGSYYIPYVLPGAYTVTITANGFSKHVQDNVIIQANESRGLNVQLQLGATAQTVTVTNAPPLLQTEGGSGNTVLTFHELENTPLNGRQVYDLIGTVPGSQFLQTQFGASGYSGTRGWDVSNNYTIGGGVQGYQQFLLDGTNITLQFHGSQGTWIFAPNVDSLQEMNVMTTTYNARFGRTGGGTVNMVTKEGTNQFRGEVYDVFHNGALDANNFENNMNGIPRQNVHENQFGVTVGGPIIRNKVFFFGAFEGYIENIPFTTVTSVPPASLRPQNGSGVDFTQTGYTLFDPNTTVCTVAGGVIGDCPGNAYSRTPFANDILPANRISPIGAAVLNLYPMPNTGGGLQNNYIANVPDKYRYWQPMVRVDYDLSDKTRMYSEYFYQHGTEFRNVSGFPPPAENGNINTMRSPLIAAQDVTHVFSPTLISDFHFSYVRFVASFPDGDLTSTVTPSSIGLNMPDVPTTTRDLLPQFSAGLYPQVVGNSVSNDVFNTYSFNNDWTKTLGNHTIHWGGEIKLDQYGNPGAVGNPNGVFSFGTAATQYNPLQRNKLSGINDGFEIGDMLLGDPSSGRVDYNDTMFEYQPIWSLYVQDNWKALHNLTFNIGLRYDVQVGLRERYNRLNRGMCFTCVNPITNDPVFQANVARNAATYIADGLDPAKIATVYGGFEFPGVNGNTRDAYDTDYSGIEPRFGFAYSINDKTVLRGGYGIIYAVGLEGGTADGFSISTPYVNSLNGGVTPTNYFASGNPFPNGVQTPPGNSLGLMTALGNGASIDFPGRRIPRSQVFSFGFERSLPSQAVLSVRYVGNYTDRLRVFVWNNGTMDYNTLQQGIANPELFNKQVPNPYYGVPGIPPSSSCGSHKTFERVRLLTPLSQYCGLIGQYNDPLGKQYYNGLEVKLEKRTTHGLSFRIAYTYSKTMAQTGYQNGWPYQDTELKKQIAGQDRTHIFSNTTEWELPIGKGRAVLSNAHGVLGALVNGWAADWSISAETGTPTGLDAGYWYSCNHPYAPDGGPTLSHYLYNDYSSGSKLGCYTSIPQYGLMNLPNRISGLRNPTIVNLNFALHKQFSVTERVKVEFRGEAFNATNTVLFPGPDNNPGDGPPKQQANGTWTGFGTVNLFQQNFPRQVKLTMKVFF